MDTSLSRDVMLIIYLLMIMLPSALPWFVPSRLVVPVALLVCLMLVSSTMLVGFGPLTIFIAMTCTSCLAGAYMKKVGLGAEA